MTQSSKYIISEFYDFKADRNVITEAEIANKPIKLKGILQKANTENRNGRVYPYEILKREADKYMEAVKERRALGEIDHPECVDNQSLILTSDGWKEAKNITEEDFILTLNKDTNKIEIQKPTHITHKHYQGTMFQVKGHHVDITVTPNHRFFLEDKEGNRFFKTAFELSKERDNKWKILKKGIWEGNEEEFFILPGIPEIHLLKKLPKELKERYSKNLKIKSETWFAFLGIYLAEGHCVGTRGYEKRKFKVAITQKKEDVKNKIRDLLDEFPILFTEYTYPDGKSDFITADARLHKYLSKLGNSKEKYIPTETKQASPYLLNILFEWFLMGDGKKTKNRDKEPRITVFSTSEKLIFDFQEVLLKMGAHGTIHYEDRKDRKIIDKKIVVSVNEFGKETEETIQTDRIIKKENSSRMFFLHLSTINHIYLNKDVKITQIDYDDLVHCVTVPNEVFCVMFNGKSHWTGNSPIISLSNSSHLVTNMWWEGETLMGEVELVGTDEPFSSGSKLKGLLKSGVMLGISSRGVGSVKNIKGKDVVQNDFELIAFDFVSSPSTPGAYMFKEARQWGMTKLEDSDYKKFEKTNNTTKKENKIITISKENYWNNL